MDLEDGPYQIEVEPVDDLSPSVFDHIDKMLEKSSELDQIYGLKRAGLYSGAVISAAYIGEKVNKYLR